MDVSAIVDRLGGIATRQQLLAAGCSGTDLTRAVRLGQLRRLRQARYATSSALPAAVVAARVGGMIAGPTAARSYGLWGGTDVRVHVSVGDNSARLRTKRAADGSADTLVDFGSTPVVVHWLKGGATPERGPECWRVGLDVCLRQVAAWCDRETAIACLDTALTATSLRPADLERLFRAEPAAQRLVAAAARPGSDSGLESIARQRLAAVGIVVRQRVVVPGVGRLDMVIPGTRVAVELDGRVFHDTGAAFEVDHRRDAELAARNLVAVRFTYRQVLTDWDWCLRTLRAVLEHHP